MTIYATHESPLGKLLLTSEEDKLTGLYFADQPHAPKIGSDWVEKPDAEIFAQTRQHLAEYVAGTRKRFDLSQVVLKGTPAQVRVWTEIAAIPFGLTMTYSELAQRIGTADAVRAVGGATGRNPVSWMIPCHRVMGKNGTLTGYAGGVHRKKALLDFEAGRSTGKDVALKLEEKPAVAPV